MERLYSGSSSKKRTPPCAREISPGLLLVVPPVKETDVAFCKVVEKPYYFLLIAFLGMYLPWAFVTRPMYNYTFLSPSVFYCGFLATYMLGILKTYRKPIGKTTVGNLIVFVMLGVCAVNFVMFYPAFAGIPVSEGLAAILFGWSTLRTYPFMIPL